MSDKIKRAQLLAEFVHFGQKRSNGEDYINHCYRVAQDNGYFMGHKKEDEDIICAAFLHDCIEDAPIKWEMNDFILNVFGYDIWDIVITLTHDPKLESYNEYFIKVFDHPKAGQIKWADMIDNTHHPIPEKQWLKYRRVCILLREKGIEIPKILQERLKL